MRPNDLLNLNLINFSTLYASLKSSYTPERKDLIDILIEILLCLPNKAEITATLVNQMCKNDHLFRINFVQHFSERTIENENELICLCLALQHLECKESEFFDQVLDKYFKGWNKFIEYLKDSKLEIKKKQEEKTDQSLYIDNLDEQNTQILFDEKSYSYLNWEIIKINDINLQERISNNINNDVSITTELCKIIIKNTKCNPQECYNQLASFLNENNIIDLVKAFGKIDAEELHVIFLLGNLKDFTKVFLKNCPDKRILCFLFERYYNEKGTRLKENEEMFILKNLVDKSTWKFFTTFCLRKDLEEFFETKITEPVYNNDSEIFFDSLKKNDFVKNETFFSDFCMNSANSISHFLINVERFSHLFDLNSKEQQSFAKCIIESFNENPIFLEVIVNKMIKFNIINQEIFNNLLNIN
ncbi:hypothetical protein H312_00820 [Anncaliia algerae PRA339]|uniref:MI domain-containing protein n=1 Tax=Anncaliia algerae PRA339 TaxID=1288291 RepID=A0A059F3J5_9MICR|nr:hypothetical protein H312_00820 [Anncaliia algerae PRA339]